MTTPRLIESDTHLKRVASTGGGEYHGPCPFCGGEDRFIVQPHRDNGGRWSCRQCEPSWQDAIAYVMKAFSLEFVEACKHLNLTLSERPSLRQQRSSKPHVPRPAVAVSKSDDWIALTEDDWQRAAADFCHSSQDTLWGPQGQIARTYLHQRGLTDDIIKAAELGFNPHNRYERWSFALDRDVWLPEGVIIPWKIDGRYWRVNIRQRNGRTPKYIQPAGCANGLYRADLLIPGCTVIMVESELDALAILSNIPSEFLAESNVVPVATGSASGAHLARWVIRVSVAHRVLLAFDDDPAGEQAAQWWTGALGTKARRLRPIRHDVTDMVIAGLELTQWLRPFTE